MNRKDSHKIMPQSFKGTKIAELLDLTNIRNVAFKYFLGLFLENVKQKIIEMNKCKHRHRRAFGGLVGGSHGRVGGPGGCGR